VYLRRRLTGNARTMPSDAVSILRKALSSSIRQQLHQPEHRHIRVRLILLWYCSYRSPLLSPRLLHAVLLVPKMHAGAHVPAMSSCPATHTGERSDYRPSQWSQRVLDRNDLHSCYALGDQSCGFEIAKSSRKHPLGNTPEVATQLPMSMRPLSQRKQNFGGPSADIEWRGHFGPCRLSVMNQT
jgi:hypothetical protein